MTRERFNELVNGPLYDPIGPVMVQQLVVALRVVLATAGEAGDEALEAYCERTRREPYANE
jgi:hypothetical protein